MGGASPSGPGPVGQRAGGPAGPGRIFTVREADACRAGPAPDERVRQRGLGSSRHRCACPILYRYRRPDGAGKTARWTGRPAASRRFHSRSAMPGLVAGAFRPVRTGVSHIAASDNLGSRPPGREAHRIESEAWLLAREKEVAHADDDSHHGIDGAADHDDQIQA